MIAPLSGQLSLKLYFSSNSNLIVSCGLIMVKSIGVKLIFVIREQAHKIYLLQIFKQFQPQFDAVNAKRRAIVAGEHEPTDEEADTPLLHGVTQETLEVF